MESTSLTQLHTRKCFIQRDYSQGTKIRFETNLPAELEGILSPAEFKQFMNGLNEIYLDSEKIRFWEGCCACLTAYLLYCCYETHKEKKVRKASEFIESQNQIWQDRGVTIYDPFYRGFRILEVQIKKIM